MAPLTESFLYFIYVYLFVWIFMPILWAIFVIMGAPNSFFSREMGPAAAYIGAGSGRGGKFVLMGAILGFLINAMGAWDPLIKYPTQKIIFGHVFARFQVRKKGLNRQFAFSFF
jgi:hypothetical protein